MALHGHTVLAATDLSDAADAALRQAHAMASDLGAPLVVCHVLPEAFNVRLLFPQEAGIDPAVQAELERLALSAVRDRVAETIGSGDIEVQIETGSPHSGILTIADRLGAGVIVLGPGRTAHHVARSATVPVLVARPSPAGGGVLGATDFSDPSLPAVRMAAEEATRRGVPLRLVHCLDVDETAYVGGAGLPGMIAPWPLPESVIGDLQSAARQRLQAAVDAVGARADAHVLRRSPAHGIVEAAQSVATALVVVGTRGRTGLARLALGSVAEAVIDRAPCSVMVVPLHPA